MVTPTHALSLRQPWAWAIFNAGKLIENRSWPTNFRGPIYIHAASKLDTPEAIEVCFESCRLNDAKPPELYRLVRSAIIGTVEIVNCVPYSRLKPDKIQRIWAFGKFCFVLQNPVLLDKPVSMRGQLGIWRVVFGDNVSMR